MKTLHTIPIAVVAQAVALLHKPCDCCGRPWTVKAIADAFSVHRMNLFRAIRAYEVQTSPASNTTRGDE